MGYMEWRNARMFRLTKRRHHPRAIRNRFCHKLANCSLTLGNSVYTVLDKTIFVEHGLILLLSVYDAYAILIIRLLMRLTATLVGRASAQPVSCQKPVHMCLGRLHSGDLLAEGLPAARQ